MEYICLKTYCALFSFMVSSWVFQHSDMDQKYIFRHRIYSYNSYIVIKLYRNSNSNKMFIFFMI